MRASIRKSDSKIHRYFSVVENKRVARGRHNRAKIAAPPRGHVASSKHAAGL
jgi:hypothetical protein